MRKHTFISHSVWVFACILFSLSAKSQHIADLAVTKTVSNSTPVVGTDITYTIRAINNGPDNAEVLVSDTFPAGETVVDVTLISNVSAADSRGNILRIFSL